MAYVSRCQYDCSQLYYICCNDDKNMQFIMLLLPVKDNEGHTGP